MPGSARRCAGALATLLALFASATKVEARAGALGTLPIQAEAIGNAEFSAAEAAVSMSPVSIPAAGSVSLSPDTPCTNAQEPTRQLPRSSRRQSRMFGWLWRSTRNIDIERTGAPLLFYLRSPLLTALPEQPDCPHELALQEARAHANCAALAVNPGQDDAYSVAVTLPQLAAASPAKLAAVLRNRLDRGERVVLRALSGADIELNPDRIRDVDARACVADA